MKRIIYILFALCCSMGARGQYVPQLSYEASAAGDGWSKHIAITTNHTEVSAVDTYTVIVNITDASLKTTGNGGVINNTGTVNGENVPYDLVFSTDVHGVTLLNWYVKYYDGVTNGQIIAFAKLVDLSTSTNLTFTMAYGKSSVSSFQGGSAGSAWDSKYVFVSPLGNGTTLNPNDFSVNANNGTVTTGVAATGINGGCANFGSGGNINYPTSTNYNNTTSTWSCWVKTSQSLSGGTPNPGFLGRHSSSSSVSGITCFLYNGYATGGFVVTIKSASTGVDNYTTSGGPYNDGNWHFFSVSLNGNSAPVIYIDGSSAGTTSNAPPSGWSFGANPIRIAKMSDGFWSQWNGSVEEVAVSNVSRSSGWTLTMYYIQKPSSDFLTYGTPY